MKEQFLNQFFFIRIYLQNLLSLMSYFLNSFKFLRCGMFDVESSLNQLVFQVVNNEVDGDRIIFILLGPFSWHDNVCIF